MRAGRLNALQMQTSCAVLSVRTWHVAMRAILTALTASYADYASFPGSAGTLPLPLLDLVSGPRASSCCMRPLHVRRRCCSTGEPPLQCSAADPAKPMHLGIAALAPGVAAPMARASRRTRLTEPSP